MPKPIVEVEGAKEKELTGKLPTGAEFSSIHDQLQPLPGAARRQRLCNLRRQTSIQESRDESL
jgi:hypothetical protein